MRDLLEKLESEMRHKFEVVRSKFENSGNKGTNTEAILREFLRSYLPRRYGVGHGEIVDSLGGRSAQTDIVIVTDEHPFTFTADQPGLFFMEGVFTVGEVKSILTSQELEKTVANALKFRELKCAPRGMTILLKSMNESYDERFVGNPPYFLFAFESQITRETIVKRLVAQNKRSVDAVFILNQGAILDLGDGKGDLQVIQPDGTPFSGWHDVGGANILACLLLWLSGMPDVQHQGSILSKYLLAALKSSNSTEQSISLKKEEDLNA
jgi:hypothetical protein